MLCTYLDLKTKLYNIAVVLSSAGILFHDDSTICSEVKCFERNLGVHIFIIRFYNHLEGAYSNLLCAVWVNP